MITFTRARPSDDNYKRVLDEVARNPHITYLIMVTRADASESPNETAIERLNRALRAATTGKKKRLMNLSVVYDTERYPYELKRKNAEYNRAYAIMPLSPSGQDMVRKVVNVWGANAGTARLASRGSVRYAMPEPKPDLCYYVRYLEKKGKGGKGSVDAASVNETWWFKWFLAVPRCASGRLAQMSRTCWFNTALNVLLLSPRLSAIVKARAEGARDVQEAAAGKTLADVLASCPSNADGVRKMVLTLAQSLLVRGDRLHRDADPGGSYDTSNVSRLAATVVPAEEMMGDAERAEVREMIRSGAQLKGESGRPVQALLVMLMSIGVGVQLVDDMEAAKKVAAEDDKVSVIVVKGPGEGAGGAAGSAAPDNFALEAATLLVGCDEEGKGTCRGSVSGLMCDDAPYVYDSNQNQVWTNVDWVERLPEVKSESRYTLESRVFVRVGSGTTEKKTEVEKAKEQEKERQTEMQDERAESRARSAGLKAAASSSGRRKASWFDAAPATTDALTPRPAGAGGLPDPTSSASAAARHAAAADAADAEARRRKVRELRDKSRARETLLREAIASEGVGGSSVARLGVALALPALLAVNAVVPMVIASRLSSSSEGFENDDDDEKKKIGRGGWMRALLMFALALAGLVGIRLLLARARRHGLVLAWVAVVLPLWAASLWIRSRDSSYFRSPLPSESEK